MTNISVLGIDLAKNVFQLHGMDQSGKKNIKQKVNQGETHRICFEPKAMHYRY